MCSAGRGCCHGAEKLGLLRYKSACSFREGLGLCKVQRALIHMNALRFANEVSFVAVLREPLVRGYNPGDGHEGPTDH